MVAMVVHVTTDSILILNQLSLYQQDGIMEEVDVEK
jgi:hypothetical protein